MKKRKINLSSDSPCGLKAQAYKTSISIMFFNLLFMKIVYNMI